MIDRTNRVVLSVLGLLLVALGVVGLLAAAAVIALPQPSQAAATAESQIGANVALWVAGAVIVGLILLWLGLRWALAQLRVPALSRPGDLTVETTPRGATRLDADALERVTALELRRLDGVDDASARLVEREPVTLRCALQVPVDRNPHALAAAAEDVRQHASDALSAPVAWYLDLQLVGRSQPRVR